MERGWDSGVTGSRHRLEEEGTALWGQSQNSWHLPQVLSTAPMCKWVWLRVSEILLDYFRIFQGVFYLFFPAIAL